jgi:hypothetical protein
MFNIKKAERRECKERPYPSTYFPKGDNLCDHLPMTPIHPFMAGSN